MRTPRALAIICAVLLAAMDVAAGPRAQGSPAQKSVFISVVDASSRPVEDLQAKEVGIAEDTTQLPITGFKHATSPLSVALLVDTTGGVDAYVEEFRRSLTNFIRRILKARADSEIMLMEFGQTALPLSPFTGTAVDLGRSLSRLSARKDAPSALLDAIAESSKQLARRPSPRRAIVVLNIEPSKEQSAIRPNQVVEELKQSNASVWVVSLQNGALSDPTRGVVLPVLAQNTGGLREFILAAPAIDVKLQQIADSLLTQYEITYARPPASTPKVVLVRVVRPGLTIRAPAWPPQ